MQHHPAVRAAIIGGIIAPILFTVLVILGGALDGGYSHVSQKVSELGGSGAANPMLQNVNFILLGLLVIGFAWAIGRVFAPALIPAVLIGSFGVSSAILNGLLPCDVGCRGATTMGLLHNITGFVGFVGIVAGMLVLSQRWWGDPAWSSHARLSVLLALIGIGGLVWFAVTQAVDAQGLAGVAQRSFILPILVWIALTATRMVATTQVEGQT